MNNWEKFAKILGLKLEQEFVLINVDGNRKNEYIYKITEDGLLYKMPTQYVNWSKSSSGTIVKLLNGDYKALAKPWKPEKRDKYFYYSNSTYFDGINSSVWNGGVLDLVLWKSGNCFKTEEEAKTKGKEIIEQIRNEYDKSIEKYMCEELGL